MKSGLAPIFFLSLIFVISLPVEPLRAETYKDQLDSANGNVLETCPEGVQEFSVSHWFLGEIGAMKVSVERSGSKFLVKRQANIQVSVNIPIIRYAHNHVSEGSEVWSASGLESFDYKSRDSSSNWVGEIRSAVSGRTSADFLSMKVRVSGADQVAADYAYPLPANGNFSLWTETPWCGALVYADSIVDVVGGQIYEFSGRTRRSVRSQGDGGIKVVVSGLRSRFFDGVRQTDQSRSRTTLTTDRVGRIRSAEIVKFGEKLQVHRR